MDFGISEFSLYFPKFILKSVSAPAINGLFDLLSVLHCTALYCNEKLRSTIDRKINTLFVCIQHIQQTYKQLIRYIWMVKDEKLSSENVDNYYFRKLANLNRKIRNIRFSKKKGSLKRNG